MVTTHVGTHPRKKTSTRLPCARAMSNRRPSRMIERMVMEIDVDEIPGFLRSVVNRLTSVKT